MVTQQSFRRTRRKIELSRLKESGSPSSSQSRLGRKWITAVIISGVSFVAGTLPSTLGTEYSKDLHLYLNSRFGLFESRPSLKYSSPEVSTPIAKPLAFGATANASTMSEYSTDVTISNDDFRDAKDVELDVDTPEDCSFNESPVPTSPNWTVGLMHITDTLSSGHNSDDINIKLLQKNTKLVLTFDVSCGQKKTPGKLKVHFVEGNCRPILSQISRLLRKRGSDAELPISTSDPYEIEARAREELHYARAGEIIYTLPAQTEVGMISTFSTKKDVSVWGQVTDMEGQDNRMRPTFMTLQFSNSANLRPVLLTEQAGTKSEPLPATPEEADALQSLVLAGTTTTFFSQLFSVATQNLDPLQGNEIVHFATHSLAVPSIQTWETGMGFNFDDGGQELGELLTQGGTPALRSVVLSTSRALTNPTWNPAQATSDAMSTATIYYTTDGTAPLLNGHDIVSYAYDAGNRLTTAVSPGSVTSYTYDALGNIVAISQDGVVSYAYDAEDRLSTAVSPGSVTSYTYDVPARLVARSSDLANEARRNSHTTVRVSEGKEIATYGQGFATPPTLRLVQRLDERPAYVIPKVFPANLTARSLTVALLKDGHAHLSVTIDPRLSLARDIAGGGSSIKASLVKAGGANLTVAVGPKRQVDAACRDASESLIKSVLSQRYRTDDLLLQGKTLQTRKRS